MATKTVAKNAEGGKAWYYRNGGFPALPGDIITLEGDYDYIEIRNLFGTAEAPITFKGNGLNKVGFNAANAIILANCGHIIFEGAIIGANDGKYAEQGFNMQGTGNIEIRSCILQNAKVGFFNNQATGHFPNVFIHHNTIRNISDPLKSNFSEAFYLGNTSGYPVTQNSHANLRIEDNTLLDIGGDGIQIANGVNVSVKRNSITNFGLHKINDQWFGLLCGGGTSGTFEDNVLTNGMGTPFQILGTGAVVFRNNIAINCAQGLNQDGFYIRQSFPILKVSLIGNKVDKFNRRAITEVTPGLVVENTGNQFGVVIPPPPPVDPCEAIKKELADTKTQLSLIKAELKIYKDWAASTLSLLNRP